MKKVISLLCLALCFNSLCAQDIITTKKAEEIQAKVTRVSNQEIEYQKWENPDGPVYIIPAKKVLSIQYPNGNKDIISALREKPHYQGEISVGYGLGVSEASEILSTNRIALETVHGVRINRYIFMGVGVGFNYFYSKIHYIIGEPDILGCILPTFVNAKGYGHISDKFSVYMSLDLGAAFGVGGILKDRKTSFYTSVGPGINFGGKDGKARGDFSIRFQHMGTGLNAMLFRIGIGF